MTPELTALLEELRRRSAELRGRREIVSAALATLRANLDDFRAGERELDELRQRAYRMFGDQELPAFDTDTDARALSMLRLS